MSKTGPIRHARKALLWLGVIFIMLSILMGVGIMTNNASFAPKLALDLEGGTQMILAPQVSGGAPATQEQLDQAVQIIRDRVDGSGVSEAEITTQSGKNVVVSMPGVPDAKTRELIKASANMEFRAVIEADQRVTAVPEDQRTPAKDLPKPTAKPENGSDPNWVDAKLQKEFEAFDCVAEIGKGASVVHDPTKPMVACEPSTATTYILGPVEVPGTDIKDASSGPERNSQGAPTGGWSVNLEFTGPGQAAFRTVTERITPLAPPRNQFAILLDGTVISAPRSQAIIADGRASITGGFTEASAKDLAEQLKYGALPISFTIQSEQQISATLGTDQLRMGLISGIIGLVLVAIYSFFQYRLLGLVTMASLIVAGVLTYQAIILLGWAQNYRLSLAGIAGIIVAIGLTADSFIVYFERVRDELREGRALISAVETGWKRAKRTIIASKAVNLLAAFVLYMVAVGNVKGFAFTLGLTAIADLVVVFLFTHPMLQILAQTKFFGQGHRLSGLDPSLLGAVPLYRGAGQIRRFNQEAPEARGKKNTAAAAEAERRQTIAERRQAAAKTGSTGNADTKESDRG
ncbi:protein translocase subunit SecD [Paeniglutamicibacter cryotolerans]|uniref:Protein translocase subunit SecD n=1 Tax=Paeniglutamicibacter cryotolerans TaxID=670079 RepID=A0A839QL28_9MICC|nr:protein translocase subunit SecD [Paeniglutamicibacter cryotolerans]MBB2997118.1 preprotein translocase subunit SecD [Paeniglutamicibacter cryotolerans]